MRYGIIGYSGRMGREIDALFRESGHELVLGIDDQKENIAGTPQVLIDFSMPAALPRTLELLEQFKCPLVTGVTGYAPDQMEMLKSLGRRIPVVQSFNFSPGIQLMLKMTDFLKDALKDWDVEISETHHRFKKDRPSGTAKMLATAVGQEVPISSARLGNIPGDHTITFGGLGEILSISHRVLSRRTFAEGVLLSADFALRRQSGYFTFTDVLFQE